jgi:rhamnulokinase
LSAQALACNFTNEGGVSGTWRLSKNIMGLWLVQECKRQWNVSYDELTQLAAQATPFLAVIDPDSDSFLHPGELPEKICLLCKLKPTLPATQGEIVRGVETGVEVSPTLEKLEGLVGNVKSTAHHRRRNATDCSTSSLRTLPAYGSGGSDWPLPGNILMQAISLGHLSSLAEVRSVVCRSFAPQIYEPRLNAGWDEAYARLQEVMNGSCP